MQTFKNIIKQLGGVEGVPTVNCYCVLNMGIDMFFPLQAYLFFQHIEKVNLKHFMIFFLLLDIRPMHEIFNQNIIPESFWNRVNLPVEILGGKICHCRYVL